MSKLNGYILTAEGLKNISNIFYLTEINIFSGDFNVGVCGDPLMFAVAMLGF